LKRKTTVPLLLVIVARGGARSKDGAFVPSFHVSPRTTGNRCDQFYGKRRSYMLKPTTVLSVDGFEVTATFAENHNAAAVHYVKQILISSFAGKTTKLQSRDILVIPDVQRYNDNGRRYYVP
jgi:hypothetical protein